MYSVESPRSNAAIQSEVSAKLSESIDETEEGRKRRGSRDAEWIPSTTSSKVAIPPEGKARKGKSNSRK
jgi:hypothetical protein